MSKHNFMTDRQIARGSNRDFSRTIFHQTADWVAANEAANRAAVHGFDLQIWFERQGLPTAGAVFLVALNELLRDAQGRREYLAWLLTLKLPMPLVVISRDFLLNAPRMVHPYLMLTPQLDDDVFRALRDGCLYLPTGEGQRRKIA
jgi:hypothetical protein